MADVTLEPAASNIASSNLTSSSSVNDTNSSAQMGAPDDPQPMLMQQPPPPPAEYNINAAKKKKQGQYMIVSSAWRLATLAVGVIVIAVGNHGIHKSAAFRHTEALHAQCEHSGQVFGGFGSSNQHNTVTPSWLSKFRAFEGIFIFTLVLEVITLLFAACLHSLKKCHCAWILDAGMQVFLALLSATAGGVILRGAREILDFGKEVPTSLCQPRGSYSSDSSEMTTKPPIHNPHAPTDAQLKPLVKYNFLAAAGALAILNALFFLILIVFIFLSKPDKPPPQEQAQFFPMQQQMQYPQDQQMMMGGQTVQPAMVYPNNMNTMAPNYYAAPMTVVQPTYAYGSYAPPPHYPHF